MLTDSCQNGATMAPIAKENSPSEVHRTNLRLENDLWEAIDTARAHRAGNISRNTWITEAVQEKLVNDALPLMRRKSGGKAHG